MKFQKVHFFVFLLLIAIAVAGWSFIALEKDNDVISPVDDTIPEAESREWPRYVDDRLGFSIQYPPNWYHEINNNVVEFTPLSPEHPKRRSSIGLASTLSIREISTAQMLELKQLATNVEDVEINDTQGTLFLTPNAYTGGFNKHYIFPLSKENYLLINFYGGELDPDIYPFEKMISTLHIK